MKTFNNPNQCKSGLLALTLVVAMTPTLSAQSFSHAVYNFSGPNGDYRVHVGDTVTFEAVVQNGGDLWDSLIVDTVSLVVHHKIGHVQYPNLAGAGIPLPFPGDVAYVSTNLVVQPDDGDELSMNCAILWTEYAGRTGGFPSPAAAYYSEFIQVLKPAVKIFQRPRVAPAFPSIAFDGMITNTGNTPLHDVQVVSDNGTPDNASDDFMLRLPLLNTNSAVPFSGSFTAMGASSLHTVTVRGTDGLGLAVTHSSTCAIPVALSIARSGADSIQISWPDWAEGFRLESCGGVGETWRPVNSHPVFGNGKFSITLPMTTNQLYRLATTK